MCYTPPTGCGSEEHHIVNEAALDGLRAAVDAAPDDHDLRIMYGTRLLEARHASEALAAAQHVLAADPASIPALQLAADAARADGKADLAVSYRRLLVALGAGAASGSAPGPSVETAPTPDDEPDDVTPPIASEPESDSDSADPFVSDAGPADSDDVSRPAITLYDVAGLEGVKRRLHAAFLGPLRNPALQQAFGASLRGGLLLYGPPGCGKTFLARALAGELDAHFTSIGITDILDPYIGVSERNLHNRFELARRSAPCVVFLDEIDALGRKRSQQRHSAGRGIVNQLLAELDSVDVDNTGVFVLAATNQPWDVDVALRRPGRFDRTVLVLPPDRPARVAIFVHHLRARPVEALPYDDLARRTDGYSGADIAHVCASAVESALERSVAQGGVSPVAMPDLLAALSEVRPSTRAWFETARNYVLYANEAGEYDELAAYLKRMKLL
jgi:SpoVK/Ycf46/Vps4 family AAA+-type ATPase